MNKTSSWWVRPISFIIFFTFCGLVGIALIVTSAYIPSSHIIAPTLQGLGIALITTAMVAAPITLYGNTLFMSQFRELTADKRTGRRRTSAPSQQSRWNSPLPIRPGLILGYYYLKTWVEIRCAQLNMACPTRRIGSKNAGSSTKDSFRVKESNYAGIPTHVPSAGSSPGAETPCAVFHPALTCRWSRSLWRSGSHGFGQSGGDLVRNLSGSPAAGIHCKVGCLDHPCT